MPAGQPPRRRDLSLKLSDSESAEIRAAAGRAKMAPAAWVAQLALTAARGGDAAGDEGRRIAAEELARAAGLFRRHSVLLNQAVRGLNASGRPSPELQSIAERSQRAGDQVRQAADDVIRKMR